MTAVHVPSVLVSAGVLALIGWRMVHRFRRLVGRQRDHRYRPWFTVTLFPLLVLFLAIASRENLGAVAALLLALPLGVGLGRYGLATTRLEVTPEGRFYTPNAHLGIALSLLMVGRLVYRYLTVYASAKVPLAPAVYLPSPLTLALVGVLAGYYVTYAAGLLRWRSTVAGVAKTS